MKLFKVAIIVCLIAVCSTVMVYAQGFRPYKCTTTTVSGTTTPTAIQTPGSMTWYSIKPRAASTTILIFPYISTVPASVPTGAYELTAGATFSDQVHCNSPDCLSGVGNGWAAVVESGASSATVDSCTR